MTRAQPYNQLERMAAAAGKRRDALLREIDHRRSWRAKQFRNASKIVDAEAEEVTEKVPASPAEKPAATENPTSPILTIR